MNRISTLIKVPQRVSLLSFGHVRIEGEEGSHLQPSTSRI